MNDTIELVLGYLRGIWRNRWYAMVCAWLVCILGWAVVFILPDQYEVSARVIVDTQTILQPLLKGLTVEVDPNTQVALVTKTLLSRPNLEQIARLACLDTRIGDPEALDRLLRRSATKNQFTEIRAKKGKICTKSLTKTLIHRMPKEWFGRY